MIMPELNLEKIIGKSFPNIEVWCMMHRASSRWSLSLYRPTRNSDQMTLGKTQLTLDKFDF